MFRNVKIQTAFLARAFQLSFGAITNDQCAKIQFFVKVFFTPAN